MSEPRCWNADDEYWPCKLDQGLFGMAYNYYHGEHRESVACAEHIAAVCSFAWQYGVVTVTPIPNTKIVSEAALQGSSEAQGGAVPPAAPSEIAPDPLILSSGVQDGTGVTPPPASSVPSEIVSPPPTGDALEPVGVEPSVAAPEQVPPAGSDHVHSWDGFRRFDGEWRQACLAAGCVALGDVIPEEELEHRLWPAADSLGWS